MLFYSQCNRAEWAQPYAVSHCCTSFQPNLLRGNRCSSALLGASNGPIHKHPTVNEWPLVVLLSYWSASQWALPHSYCQEGSIREVFKEGWCAGHQLERERRGRFRYSFGGPGDHPALGQWVSWRSQCNRLGTTSCSAPEPSVRPSSSLGSGLEERWTSSASLSLQRTSSGHLSGPQSLRTGLLTWTALGDRTYCVGCLAPLRMKSGQNVGIMPCRSCPMRCVSAYPGWGISRWKLCLETLPSLDRARMTEKNIHLVEIYRNIITWPWPNFKHKGCDTKKSVTTYHNFLWHLLLNVLNWKRSITLSS